MNIKKFDRFQKSTPKPYIIEAEYEHGDADLTTTEKFKFDDENRFREYLNLLYDIRNFIPNTAYGKLGYFYPLREYKDMIQIAEKNGFSSDTVHEIVPSDQGSYDYPSKIEGVRVVINGDNKVIVYMKGLLTNLINLPNIGDIIEVDVNHIPGYGPQMFGGKHSDYYPNSGMKDYVQQKFKAKVLDCGINYYHNYENEHYHDYTHFPYILLLESQENVLKVGKINKLVIEKSGYDPKFEEKFNKEKYDGLNYYEL